MSTSTLQVVHVAIDMKCLRGWSTGNKRRFLMLTAMLRDLIVFHKLFMYLFFGSGKKQDQVSAAGSSTIQQSVTLVLAAKLFEMYKFVKNDIACESPAIALELQDRLKKLLEYFSAEEKRVSRLLAFIRDKLAFHYERQKDVEAMLAQEFDGLDSFNMWLSGTDSTNEVFAGTNEIMWRLVLEQMRQVGFEGDRQQLMNAFIDVIKEASVLLRGFVAKYTREMVPQEALVRHEEVPVEAKHYAEVDIPFFCAF